MTFEFIEDSAKTLTEAVRDRILKRIESNQWGPDFMLPGEIALAKEFGVSQGTVRRALAALVDSGVLVRHQGRGTFVASHRKRRIASRLDWFRYDRDAEQGTRTARHGELVGFELIPAVSTIARGLEIMPGDLVYHVSRDRTYEGLDCVCCFDEIYLPERRFPGLSRSKFEFSKAPDVYAFYEEQFGISAFRFDEVARAVLLNPEQARRAKVPMPYPGICVRRISRDVLGVPVELRLLTNVTEHQNLVLSENTYL